MHRSAAAVFKCIDTRLVMAVQAEKVHAATVQVVQVACHGLPRKWTDTSVMTTTVRLH
jgi:hypothetical protein